MNKKRIGKLLFLIVFLITLVIGFSYAFSNWSYIGSTFNKLTSSDLEISLLESETNVISLNNAFPMTDEEGLDTDSFDFAVTSKTVKEEGIRYTISIEKLEADAGYTFLNDSDVKIYLEDYEGNVLLEPTLISNLDNYKLYTGSHVHDSTNNELQDKYKLKVWIDQSKENDAKSWDLDTKIQYKFKLNINNEETNNTFTVNAVAEGGTITGNNSKKVVSGGEVRFETSPTETYSETSVSCTNSVTGEYKNNKLVAKNVNNNTTCTITYTPSKTVLYTDGTLIINEKASDRASNITIHGAVTNEYQAMSNNNSYIFITSSQPWHSQKSNITRVEIGQMIQPTSTAYWFYDLKNMSSGDFTNLDTSKVTNMSGMFQNAGYNATTFDIGDLSNWDTSKVTSMSQVFTNTGYNASTWNVGDLSNWDTSRVTSMSYMFQDAGYNASTWNVGDLLNWDTSKVTTMSDMFYYAGYNATTFELDLSNWDTSNVTTMGEMFWNAGHSAITWDIGDLSNWSVSNVTNMSYMFEYAGYSATIFDIGNLSNWDISKVTYMNNMFYEAGNNATTWNSIGTLNIYATSIYQMFAGCSKAKATLNIYSNPSSGNPGYSMAFVGAAKEDGALIVVNGSCATTNIDNIVAEKSSSSHVIKGIQFGCGTDTEYPITLDAQGGNIPSSAGWTLLNDGGVAAKNYIENTTLGTLPTPTYRNYEFLGWYTKPEDGTKITNSTVVDKSMTLYARFNIPSWNVSISVNNGTLSGDTYKIVKDYTSPTFSVSTTLEGTYVSSVTCTNGQHGAVNNGVATIYNVTNNTACTVEYSDAGSTVLYTDGTLIINEKASDREANITTHGAVTNEYAAMSNSNSYVFNASSSQPWSNKKASVTRVEIGQKIQPTNTKYWFHNLTNMSYGNFTNLDTSQSTSFYYMFYQAGNGSSVTSLELIGLDNWNTSKVTTMKDMFHQTGFYATTWDIGDLSNWKTLNVINMSQMFTQAGYTATSWSIGNLSGWDTSSVTDMSNMFMKAGYSAITWSIGDLSGWDTSKVTTTSAMFENAGRNSTDFDIGNLSDWNVSNVTTMNSMFYETGYSVTTFDIGNLSNWNTSKATNMSAMFSGAGYNATTWSIGNLSNWDTSKVTNMSSMFARTGKSATTWNIGDLSGWDTSNVTDMSDLFSAAGQNATTFDIGDLSSWDTSSVTDMSGMFDEAGLNATEWNSIGTLKVYGADVSEMFYNSPNAKATLNLMNTPASYTDTFNGAATASGSHITVNYNCISIGLVDNLLATKSSNSNVVKGTNLEGTCPDRTINVVVNNGTVNTSSTTVPNLGSATFNLTPTSGYSNPLVSCTNGQNGSMSGNTLTVSNVVSDTTCTVTYYISEAITLTENDVTYPWIETSGVWKSGNYNVNSSTSTITSESFTLTNGGIVSFEWAVSSESASYDYLYYTIYKDGVAVSGTGTSTKIGGNDTITEEANLSYTTVTKELEAGTYTIAFSYTKDSSQHTGLDRGYVKNIFVLK